MDLKEVETGKEMAEEMRGDSLAAQEVEVLSDDETPEMQEIPIEEWDYERPRRGQMRSGVILAIRDQEIIVDVDAKRDGLVPYADMQRLGDEEVAKLSVGDQVAVYILRPEDKEGNLLVSLYQARLSEAWDRAAELAESGKVWEGEVIGYNKGGLLMPVDEIRGFIPASQVPGFPHGLSHEERLQRLSSMVGNKLMVKVIEINRRNRRLILSARAAQRQWRKRQRKRLLDELREGEVRKGSVSSLCSFGAFVDLGGADGLIHISELSWRRIRHPREVVSVGDEIEVYILRLDHDRKRIGLSLKRLQPEPWSLVEEKYELGQLVEGVVTNVVDFGAFAEIEAGVEGLIHISELADAPISHPGEVVKKGDLLLLRIIRIDVRRKRLGLSLKRVLESEWAEWAARLAEEEERKKAEEEEALEKEEPAAEEATETEQISEPVAEGAAEEPEAPTVEDTADEAEEPAKEEPAEPAEVEEEVSPALSKEEEPEEPVEVEEEVSPALSKEEEPEEPEEMAEQTGEAQESSEPQAADVQETKTTEKLVEEAEVAAVVA
jgi:small subunit ribosomal protein S1